MELADIIKEAEENLNRCTPATNPFQEGIKTVLSHIIPKLKSIQDNDGWVSVDGKNFPPDNPKYYYWLYSESIDNYESGYYDFDARRFRSNAGDYLFHVTHWKLPTPPNQNKK